jgi:mannosyl-glycoprotein endo-beta-N-acetylglucosaminidase
VIDDYQIRIGRLGIVRGEQNEPAAPGGLLVEQFNQIDDNNGTIRLRWNHSPGPIYSYNVYRQNPDESRAFLWATPNNACFVPAVTRPDGEETTTILLEAVSTEFGFSPTTETQISWTTTGIESQGPQGVASFLNDLSNPVSGVVNVGFSVSAPGPVDLVVYDLAGRVVSILHEGHASAGLHSVYWDTTNLPAGVYFQTISAPGGSDRRRCTVLR